MAFSTDEREALKELKAQGYSLDEALGFIASTRMGNTSRVERDFTPEEPEAPSDAVSDLKRGFQGAQQALDEGLDRQQAASQRSSRIGRIGGTIGAGFRFAGEAVGSVIGGAIRALPGGTKAMDFVEQGVSKTVQDVASSDVGQTVARGFNALPENVKQPLGDVGNVAMGGLGLAEALVAPGATKSLSTGIREFARSGVKQMGSEGISIAKSSGLAPENIMQRVARISKGKQAEFETRAGESVGEYLVNRGIYGDPEEITTQLYNRMKDSKSRVDAGLGKVQGTYKDDTVLDALRQLSEREARVSTDLTPSPDSGRVSSLLTKFNGDGLTLSEINEVKRLYERNIKVDYLRDNVSDKIAQANNIDAQLRKLVEDRAAKSGFPNVRELNRETMLAKQLLDDLGAEYAGQQGNNYVSLSDAFFLAEAASNPTALAAFGLRKTLGSKSAMSAVAKLIAGKRAKKQLPSGDLTEPLALPAPRDGAANVRIDQPINLRDRSQTTIDAQEQARVKQPERGGGTRSAIKEVLDDTEEATEQIRAQMLDVSSTGLKTNTDGSTTRFTSFPQWVPSELRSKDLFERVWSHIDNRTVPRSNATQELELYALVRSQIDKQEMNLKALREQSQNSNDVTGEAFGIFGGIQTDEEGNITFNPFGAALGVAGVGAIKRLSDIRVSPLTVAKNMDAEDARKLDAFVSNPDDANAYLEVQPLFRALGFKEVTGGPNPAEEALKQRYGEDVLTEYARLNFNPAQSATTEGAWTGTKSSKPSTDTNTSTSKKPTGKEDVSGQSAGTSAGFSDLAAEAKKYKSAEEFERAMRKDYRVWHGTNETFETFDPSKGYKGDYGTWFSRDSSLYTSGDYQVKNVMQRYIKPNIKLATGSMADNLTSEQLMAKGYRGIKTSDESIKLFYPNEDTITRTQLEEIWKKANNK